MVVTVKIKNHVPYRIKCLTPKVIVIYEGTMVNNAEDKKRVYFGASDTTFNSFETVKIWTIFRV